MKIERKYLPTFGELVDRLSIVLLKAIFIPEHHTKYMEEVELIEHDLDLLAEKEGPLCGLDIRAILMLAIANRYIWENEAQLRSNYQKDSGVNPYPLLATHAVNGVRNKAKRVLDQGGRIDEKADCMAVEVPPEKYGDWRVI